MIGFVDSIEEWDDREEPRELALCMERPSERRRGEYLAFCEKTNGDVSETDRWLVDAPEDVREKFDEVLERKRAERKFGIQEFWAFDEGEMVGVLMMRERLTEPQLTYGGHVRVVVRADKRRDGYGREILRMAYKAGRKVVKDGEEMILTVDARDKGAWKMVRGATFDEICPIRPGKRGVPACVYRFRVRLGKRTVG